LYYVSPSLVNMQFPSELTPDRVYPVVIIANGAISMPELVDVVSVQPVVLGFLDHSIVAQNALKGSVLVDAQHPAQPGDFLVIYVIGMGATNPVVPTGQPTPFTAPLSVPNVTPTLTIDGNTVPIAFAGMTPTAIGLFQINFQIPANVRLNTPLEVVVKQGNASSRVVTLTVVP
jgi:uncharacterized protein (TIGR03437 family)